jgi:CBS domain-containing protein
MRTVQELLASKPAGVVTISPDAAVFAALERMAAHDIGALVVVDAGRVTGILSERDYARKVILHHKSSREIPVAEIMTTPVVSVTLTHTLEECMALMSDKRIRHLPVLDGDRLVGVLSIGDLVRATISEQAFAIRQLEGYIAS